MLNLIKMENRTLNTPLFFDARWQQYTLEIVDSQPVKINITQGIERRRITEIIF